MDTLKNLTLMQWIGIVLLANGVLTGSINEMTDLVGPIWARHLTSIAVMGSAFCGGIVTMFGGQAAMMSRAMSTQGGQDTLIRSVLSMPGVENMAINGRATAALATLAVDPAVDKISPTPAAMDKVTAIAAIAKAAAAVLLAIMLSAALMIGGSGFAEAAAKAKPAATTTAACLIPFDPLKLCGALSGNVSTDIQRVATRISKINKDDLIYAMAKAKAANTAASAIRMQCIQAISVANDQFNGAGLKNADGSAMVRPDPAVVTAIEDIAELIDNLSPQGDLFTSCAGAAQMFKTDTLTAINGIVTGAVGLATASAVGL
jgi:hypothetical protein